MRRKSIQLTEGALLPAIVRFSVPLMLSNVLQVLFNMSDIAVVGRFAGAEALGAVGSTTILVSLFTGFMIGMGAGVNHVAEAFRAAGMKDVTVRLWPEARHELFNETNRDEVMQDLLQWMNEKRG